MPLAKLAIRLRNRANPYHRVKKKAAPSGSGQILASSSQATGLVFWQGQRLIHPKLRRQPKPLQPPP